MRADNITLVEELANIKDEWSGLHHGSYPILFPEVEWSYSWLSVSSTKCQLFVIKVNDDGNRLVGIAPWYTEKIKVGRDDHTVKFYSTPETASDYLDVFAAKGREKEVSNYLYDYLFGELSNSWDCLSLQDTRAESLFLLNFIHKHRLKGRHFEISQGSFCPIISLPQTEAEFLSQISSSRSKRFRQDLRTLKKTTGEIRTHVTMVRRSVESFSRYTRKKKEWKERTFTGL